MCAHFTLKAKANELAKKFKIKISEDLDFNVSVRGFMKTELAPIILFDKNRAIIKEACFSLVPSWSKEFPVKFTTYNARLERENPKTGKPEFIYEVPTWKDSFSKGKTCFVPMNFAFESSYFGSHAGHIIKFSTTSETVFFAAGLYSEWLNKETGEVKETFTLLTDDPYPYFFKAGHDRSIIALDESVYDQWLSSKMEPKERLLFLRKNRIDLDWKVETDRPMKAGWEKRAPTSEEISHIKVWNG